jgi:hypothetical protein
VKPIKTFGLAVMAALAMVFVGASSAIAGSTSFFTVECDVLFLGEVQKDGTTKRS